MAHAELPPTFWADLSSLLFMILPFLALLLAQTHTFEVASVKPSRPDAGPRDVRISFPNNRLEALNVTVADLLYQINMRAPVKGGPGWIYSDRFDIEAKVDESAGPLDGPERQKMLLALLNERFKMTSHVESKEVQGLALVAGKKAPKLDPVKEGEGTHAEVDDKGRFVFTKMSMTGLANVLTTRMQAPVSDRTGIAGQFDFLLDPNKFVGEPPVSYPDRVRAAVEELGLRFEAEKATQYTLVIDHAERPEAN